MEIKQSDLLQLVAQYLQEAKLFNTLEALGQETDMKFNFVSSKDEIKNLIMSGSIIDLLERMKTWELSDSCTQKVYTLIFYQLLADEEVDMAHNFLVNAQPLISLRDSDPETYLIFSEMNSVGVDDLVKQRELVVELVIKEVEQVCFGGINIIGFRK